MRFESLKKELRYMCIDQDNLGCIVVTENLIQTDLNDKDNLLTYVTEKAQGTFQTNFDQGSNFVFL